ncbi:unnamed protein product [Ectocarpus sp. CCAP 1310/34]|nr:unnamed protein product [Ectocarpus sp. CCAP 1310/34]
MLKNAQDMQDRRGMDPFYKHIHTRPPRSQSSPQGIFLSSSFGCSYCSAHCAGLGTIRQGHDVFLTKNAQAMMPVPGPGVFNPKELAVINIGKKLGAVPNEVTSDDIQSMARALTSEEQECVINAMVLMGFLNRFMLMMTNDCFCSRMDESPRGTFGMTLELEPLETGNKHLAESGWTAGISFDPEGDEELMEEDRAMAERREERKKQACGGFTFLKMLVGAKMADSASLKGTPTSEKNVKQLCTERAGFAPYYLVGEEKSKMANARNALVWAFTRRLCQGSEEVPAATKQTMGYMLATSADNTILRAHFAFMAHRNGVSVSNLASATAEGGDTDGGEDLKKAAALSMARACGGTPGPLPRELVALLMRQYTPAGVIELVNTLSLVSMLQRWTSIYMPKQ